MKKNNKSVFRNIFIKLLAFLFLVDMVILFSLNIVDLFANKTIADYSQYIVEKGNALITFDPINEILYLEAGFEDHIRYEVIENNQVIYSKGPEIGGEKYYSQDKLNQIINRNYLFLESYTYVAEYTPFSGPNGEAYALIIKERKVDSSPAEIGITLPEYLRGSELERELRQTITNLLLVLFAFLLVFIIILSYLMAKKIIKPLIFLRRGLERVIDGDLGVRLDFKGDKEFIWVRDAFNTMINRLDLSERERDDLMKSKKQFLLDLSHDLKTPMTTISGYSRALSDGIVSNEEEEKKYLNYIHDKTSQMEYLVNRLFDYARLDNGIIKINPQPLDICNEFTEIIINAYGEIESHSFHPVINIPDKVIIIDLDKNEFFRAVSNIISNALKYNPPETNILFELEDTQDSVKIIIADDGIGIHEEVQSKIFEVLTRGDESRHGKSGTGLGLAITKKIVELHGGSIELQSQINIGSKFIITLYKTK